VAASRRDEQAVAAAERHGASIGEGQPGTALKQGHPLVFSLFVPEPIRTGGGTGVDALQAQARRLEQHLGVLLPLGRAGAPQQVALAPGGRGLAFTPAAADLEALAARQLHHLCMAGAIAQPLAQGGLRLAALDEGIQLAHLLQELLQLLFGHGGR